ncbi:MAG: ribosome silencing factor [Syntrophales bacterium]|nr:ribosome silencing factor [Syntrophales bacterium]
MVSKKVEEGLQERVLRCVNSALKRKARRLTVLDVQGYSSFADFIIICSGSSDRQVKAIASWIREDLERYGMTPLGVEGEQHGRWILMDYEDIIIHIFLDPVREFYDIERLWIDVPKVTLDDDTVELKTLSGLKVVH